MLAGRARGRRTPPCSPTISISFGLSNWPQPNTRTTFPSASIVLIRGIRRLPSPWPILENKTGPVAGPAAAPGSRGSRSEEQANLPDASNQGVLSLGRSTEGRAGRAMPPTRKPLADQHGLAVFWRSFLLIFWSSSGSSGSVSASCRCAAGAPTVVFLLVPKATRRSVFHAMLLAGCVTLVATLFVQLIVRPLLKLWLKPAVDPRAGCSTCRPARRWSPASRAGGSPDGRWRPGALVADQSPDLVLPRGLGRRDLVADRENDSSGSRPDARASPGWPHPELAGAVAFLGPDGRARLLRRGRSRRGPGLVHARARTPDGDRLATASRPKEPSMPDRFKVLIADFLDETSIESAVLDDIADLVMARASDESELDRVLARGRCDHGLPRPLDPGRAELSRGAAMPRRRPGGVGYNNIDLEAATRHGVIVCNVPDYGTEEVADHAIMFLLALARRLVPSHEAIRAGTWDYRTALGTPRLRGKTFGIIGCGRIGTATALRAKALGLDVVFYDPYLRQGMDKALGIRRVYQLDELLEQSHFVSLHCYLDAANRHLINARTIARMRPGAMLINTARGPLIDEDALLDALDSGQHRRRRPRRRRARAARQRPPAPASECPVHAPHGVLQRRGLQRAAHQDRRGSPPHPAGRAAAEPGECHPRSAGMSPVE